MQGLVLILIGRARVIRFVFSSVIDVLLNVKSLFEHFDDEAMPRDRQQQYAKEILEDDEDAAEVSKDVQK